MTEEKMLAVAVGFADRMGWIDSPGAGEWYSQMRDAGGPEEFANKLFEALRGALADPIEQSCTTAQALAEMAARYRHTSEGAACGRRLAIAGGWHDSDVLLKIYQGGREKGQA